MPARPYQIEQIDKVITALSIHRKVCLQLPTGGGKTWEFAMISERYCHKTSKSVLICVDRIELLKQAEKTIRDVGIIPRIIDSNTKHYQVARVYICMVESLSSRMDLFENVGLVIIDECHVANFNKVHSWFLEELIIGVTATPISSSKKNPLNKFYNHIVVGPQINELIEMGYLAQDTTRCPKELVDREKLTVDKMTGDYNELQLATEYKMPRMVANVVAQYEKFCMGQKTLVFNVNREHSKKVDQAFRLMGHSSRFLDSQASDEERADTLKWFRETEDAVLHNVGLFTRGFDEPSIRNIILNFSTISIPKLLQCAGRGGRIIDEYFIEKYQHLYAYKLPIKKEFQIIDLGGNSSSGIGGWSDNRDWEFVFNNPEIPGDGVAPTKVCPRCEGLVHAAISVCNLRLPDLTDCLYEFEKKKPAPEKIDMEMVIINRNIDIEQIVERFSNKYDYYPFFRLGEEVVRNLFDGITSYPNEQQLDKAFKSYYNLCKKWHLQYRVGKTISGKPEPIDISESEWHLKRAKRNFQILIDKRKMSEPPFDWSSRYNEEKANYETHVERVITEVVASMYEDNQN